MTRPRGTHPEPNPKRGGPGPQVRPELIKHPEVPGDDAGNIVAAATGGTGAGYVPG